MNWGRQVFHVAANDVRRTRASMGVYALIVAATALSNLGGGPGLFILLVLLAGTLYTVDLILHDSPYRSDAFWASKPLDGTAVLAAKVLVTSAVIIGCAVLAHAGVLVIRYGSIPPALGAHATSGALTVADFVFGAALIGAVTPNLRTFFLVLAAQFIAGNWLAVWMLNAGMPERTLPAAVQLPVLALSTAVALLSIAWIYRTRNRTQGILLAIAMTLFPVAASTAAERFATMPELPASETMPVLRIVEIPSRFSAPGEFHITVQLENFDPSRQYTLERPRAELRFVDGRVTRVRIPLNRVSLNHPTPPIDSAQWIGGFTIAAAQTDSAVGRRQSLRLEITPAEEAALKAGDASLAIYGRLNVLEPHVVAKLPLEAGRSITAAGERLEIDSVQSKFAGVRFWISGIKLSRDDGDAVAFLPRYALLNRARGEAVELWNRSGSSSMLGVIPTSYSPSDYQFEVESPENDARYRLNPDWFRNLELVRIQWRELGGYGIMITAAATRVVRPQR